MCVCVTGCVCVCDVEVVANSFPHTSDMLEALDLAAPHDFFPFDHHFSSIFRVLFWD